MLRSIYFILHGVNRGGKLCCVCFDVSARACETSLPRERRGVMLGNRLARVTMGLLILRRLRLL